MAIVHYSPKLDNSFIKTISSAIKDQFAGCKKIAVKLHFGEPDNKNSFQPHHIQPFTDLLQGLGMDYFMYDSSVNYPGLRSNPKTHLKAAEKKGYDRLGEIRTNDDFVISKGENMDYQVCKELADADGVLVISHFKGHCCCGFGGAVKNLGMGALTPKSKGDIHTGGEPVFTGECSQCGMCAKSCPIGGIIISDKPDFNQCFGCSNCTTVCPDNLLRPKLKTFDELLSDGAAAAQRKFKKKLYINQMINISRLCDCTRGDPGEKIADDAGYLLSEDPCSIDHAARDIIIQKQGEDVFLKANKKTGLEHVRWAEKFGMGEMDYQLIQ
jgi:hypothetical protein